MKRGVLWLALLVVVLSMSGVLLAQEEEPRISTLFYEEDIREALNELVLQTGVNVIYDDTVRGTVTLDLDDVPLERALRLILLSGGFTYRQVEDYYIVGLADPRSEMFRNLTETERIQLRYLTASEARGLLPTFYDRYLRTPGEGYTMTVTGPPDVLERLRADLAKIDTPQQEVLIKVLVTEISAEVLEELGGTFFNWSTQGAPTDSSPLVCLTRAPYPLRRASSVHWRPASGR